MPKLREKRARRPSRLEAGKADADATSSSFKTDKFWTREERAELITLIRKYGTHDLQLLSKKMKNRNVYQIEQYLKHARIWYGEQRPEMVGSPVDGWLRVLPRVYGTAGARVNRCEREALTATLHMAAIQERQCAQRENRDDLSPVYTYLAQLSSNKIPPSPAPKTARQLLALLHHLAALMRNISLGPFTQWLKEDEHVSQLVDGLGKTLEVTEPPLDGVCDLSLVPELLQPALSQLVRPLSNPLQVSATRLLTPLQSSLNDSVLRRRGAAYDQLDMLDSAIHVQPDIFSDDEPPASAASAPPTKANGHTTTTSSASTPAASCSGRTSGSVMVAAAGTSGEPVWNTAATLIRPMKTYTRRRPAVKQEAPGGGPESGGGQ